MNPTDFYWFLPDWIKIISGHSIYVDFKSKKTDNSWNAKRLYLFKFKQFRIMESHKLKLSVPKVLGSQSAPKVFQNNSAVVDKLEQTYFPKGSCRPFHRITKNSEFSLSLSDYYWCEIGWFFTWNGINSINGLDGFTLMWLLKGFPIPNNHTRRRALPDRGLGRKSRMVSVLTQTIYWLEIYYD